MANIIGVANIKNSTHVRNKTVRFQERSPYVEILPYVFFFYFK